MYRDREAIVARVTALRSEMSLSKAIEEALRQFPGPSPRTVRTWLPKPDRKRSRPTTPHFNEWRQQAVDRVWDLIEAGWTRQAAVREVLPTVHMFASGRKDMTERRLDRWCDGPTGDRYTVLKGEYLPWQLRYDFEQFLEQGCTPSEAYRLCKHVSV